MKRTHAEKQIQRVLDGAERERLFSSRQVDGQVVELLSLGHHLTAAVDVKVNDRKLLQSLYIRPAALHFQAEDGPCLPFAGDGVLHLKLHVDSDGAGVDAGGVGLVPGLRPGLLAVLRHGGGGRRSCGFVLKAPVDLFHVVLQLVEALAQELVSILSEGRHRGRIKHNGYLRYSNAEFQDFE